MPVLRDFDIRVERHEIENAAWEYFREEYALEERDQIVVECDCLKIEKQGEATVVFDLEIVADESTYDSNRVELTNKRLVCSNCGCQDVRNLVYSNKSMCVGCESLWK